MLFSVPISVSGAVFEPGEPREVLIMPAINVRHSGGDYQFYAVAPDGQRFLVPQYVSTGAGTAGQLGPDLLSGLTVAVNWTASIRRATR